MSPKKRRPVPSSPTATDAIQEPGTPGPSPFPIVGVGASAGGLEAFRQMLGALPIDTGMGFVLVQHLSPTHASMLSEILGRTTAMPVMEVRDEPQVEPNHVYVIPPDRKMCIVKGGLRLLPREGLGELRSVDYFLHSLAEDQGSLAIGVILSGTATDGTLGLQEVKAAGGITFAQDDTAQQSGMPRSAIASGCVDFVLSPEKIAAELGRIAQHPRMARAPAPKPEAPPENADGADLAVVQKLLRDVTGVDFSQYKPNTFHRRITRRMVLRQMRTLEEYVSFLESDPVEVQALYQDILISVTSFFRNPEMFEALKAKVFPVLFKGRSPQQPLRVWVPGCSTGEEAYSLAIAIAEFAESSGSHLPVQIFATDLNETVIVKARKGVYPKSIADDVLPERLRRFFAEVDGQYRVAKAIREQCVFARHNMLTDPPFSQIDLIACRNFLIYLEASTQKRLVPLLHYALKPNGFLVLGSSETAATYRDLFEVEDSQHKIFKSKPGKRRLTQGWGDGQSRAPEPIGRIAPGPDRTRGTAADVLIEAERILLAKYAPPSVVIDAELEILQFRGDTGPYLAPTPGKASLNLLKMAREGLPLALRAAIFKARKEATSIRKEGLRVHSGGRLRGVHVEVIPLKKGPVDEGAFLVLFEEAAPSSSAPKLKGKKSKGNDPADPAANSTEEGETEELQGVRLTEELRVTREYLQSVIEQQEAANEELQSASEELQSANEELQSVNEELETSKEEIQSTNEELSTVNEELQNRNLELNQSTNDMVNFLGSVDAAIVMLGPELGLRRFTPAAEKILNLIPSDLGRPIGHVKLTIDLPELETLLREVMDSLRVVEREVQDKNGHWYLLRIRAYRTLDNRVDGAVMMLVDIDRLKSAHQFAKNIVATVRESLLVLDADLCVQTASQSFYQTFQVTPEETESHLLYDLRDRGGRHPWDLPALRRRLGEVLAENGSFEAFEVEQEFDPIGHRVLLLNARRLVHQNGDTPLILLAIEDITERKALEAALSRRVEELAAADRSKNDFLALLSHELRNPLAPLRNALNLLEVEGAEKDAILHARDIMHRQIRHMVRLIDDLLDVSRITRGKVLLRKEPVELAPLLARAVEAVQHAIDARGQELTLVLPREPIYIDADAIRIEQIFGNLLHNASKFTPPGGHIEVTAERASEALDPREIMVRVKDDGIGIDPDMLPRVFDLFVQAQRSLDRSQGGLGIGLTLVKSLVELHGGTVEARSAGLGRGSEIVVHLPLSLHAVFEVERNGSADRQTAVDRDSAAGLGRRVLVVDDNVDTAESMVLLLRLRGHEVQVAFSGPAALEAAAAFEPEIVLLDIGLPGLDGYEVARSLRQDRKAKLVLVALTGYGQEEDRRLAREAGFDYHLTKPVDPAVIYELLELREQQAEVPS
jgi:two-component system CheB/CheR fusion protein